jgi:hypothetical protein
MPSLQTSQLLRKKLQPQTNPRTSSLGMNQHFQGVALKLATLLVNNVELDVGDAFPIGWNFFTGDTEYASVTEELLQEAQYLSAKLECELASQAM